MAAELLRTEVSKTQQKLIDSQRVNSDLELKLLESEELQFSKNALWFG